MKAIFEKKTKFSGIVALFLMVLLGACKDKVSENPIHNDLVLSQTGVDIMTGESHVISITAGSGSYAVSVDNEAVAAADLDGNRITITGKSGGTATIHVKDTETQQKAQVTITVEGVPDDGEVYPQSKKLWVSPDGNGTGWRRNTPGSLAAIIGDVQPGDTVVLLEGTYTNMKIEALKGTAEQNITIRAENIGKA
ncbi:chondroitinase-B domain-containing protein, partial [Parapedobacter pyrenivorans]